MGSPKVSIAFMPNIVFITTLFSVAFGYAVEASDRYNHQLPYSPQSLPSLSNKIHPPQLAYLPDLVEPAKAESEHYIDPEIANRFPPRSDSDPPSSIAISERQLEPEHRIKLIIFSALVVAIKSNAFKKSTMQDAWAKILELATTDWTSRAEATSLKIKVGAITLALEAQEGLTIAWDAVAVIARWHHDNMHYGTFAAGLTAVVYIKADPDPTIYNILGRLFRIQQSC